MDEISKITTNEELEAYKDKLRVFVIGLYITLVLSIIIRAIQWIQHGEEF